MKTKSLNFNQGLIARSRRAYLEMDMVLAIMILSVAIVPLAFSFARERAVLRAEYVRSVADEIVDGETEILAAGEWKDFPDGAQTYTVPAHAAAELPPGRFELTKNGNHLRLEWLPNKQQGFGAISREITVK